MQEKLNIAVFVDYDNIEIGVKSTLRREFDVAIALDALKERGDIVAKFAYANWSRLEWATRQMAENAVQMVQRNPSPRGDKNGADINLALDSLEMAFTHRHVNAFAIVSGDSDFIPLVNKLKEYGKIVIVLGGKQFTSTILQQNCHEFVSYESLLLARGQQVTVVPAAAPAGEPGGPPPQKEQRDGGRYEGRYEGKFERRGKPQQQQQPPQDRPAPLDLAQAMPLVERAMQVLERRNVQPQLGLLKSTMLQLDSSFNERAYGSNSFSDFVERLAKADFIQVTGHGGRMTIDRKKGARVDIPEPEEAIPALRDFLENHRLEFEDGVPVNEASHWFAEEFPNYGVTKYGFQQFGEFMVFAQDKGVVRLEMDENHGQTMYLGAEFYPPAPPPAPEPPALDEEFEDDGPQPYVAGQPTMLDPNPKAAEKRAPAKKRIVRKKVSDGNRVAVKRPRKRKD